MILRLTNRLEVGAITLLLLISLGPTQGVGAEEPSLGAKIRKFLATPTPTPSHRPHKRVTKKSSPTPSPSPSAAPKSTAKRLHKSFPTPTPEEEETPKPKRKNPSPSPSPSASPSPRKTPTPTPDEEETPKPKRKKPSPSPSTSASPSPRKTPTPKPEESPSPEKRVAAVSPDEIEGYDKNPAAVQKLLGDALDLTKRNLGYLYGSADPAGGGMDCSGFIYYLLRENGVPDVPRDASEQYVWVRKAGNFRAVLSRDLDSFELDELKPGDLLFWTGTYSVERDPPVTHTMIYLGREKESGKPIMIGASDGRTFHGKERFGVSVFDFKTAPSKDGPSSQGQPRFVGYGRIPGL